MFQPEIQRGEHNSTYEGPSAAMAQSSYESPEAFRAATAAFRTVDSVNDVSKFYGKVTLVNDVPGSTSSPEIVPKHISSQKPDIIATLPDVEAPDVATKHIASQKPDIIPTLPEVEAPDVASKRISSQKPDIIATLPGDKAPDVAPTQPAPPTGDGDKAPDVAPTQPAPPTGDGVKAPDVAPTQPAPPTGDGVKDPDVAPTQPAPATGNVSNEPDVLPALPMAATDWHEQNKSTPRPRIWHKTAPHAAPKRSTFPTDGGVKIPEGAPTQTAPRGHVDLPFG